MFVGDVAAKTPEAQAVLFVPSGVSRTYRELDRNSIAVANQLHGLGVRRGDHVAIIAENGPFFVEATLAAHRSGLQYTTVNTHLVPPDIVYMLQDSGSRALISSSRLSDLADEVIASLGEVTRVGEADVALASDQAAGADFEETAGSPMLYSSGTTGRPKGIEFPLSGDHPREIDDFTSHFVDLFGIDHNTVMLLPGPMYHTSPQFYANMVLRVGGRLVVMERFDAEAALRTIQDHGVTHSFFVPTMLIRMLRLPADVRESFDLSTHVFSLHGAGPCAPDVKRAVSRWWGPVLWEGYAGSERNGMTILSPADAAEHCESVGRPIGCDIVIVDDGKRVGPGETGVIYFAGGYEFSYFGDPEKTTAAYLEPGVSTLGDIGHVDAEGFLYLTDRLADVVISGGVNIYPMEIESVLALHPDIADIAVIGVPHSDLGEVARAYVQVVEGLEPSDAVRAAIMDYCRGRLATYKCPRELEFVDVIPRQLNGKLMKQKLRDRFLA